MSRLTKGSLMLSRLYLILILMSASNSTLDLGEPFLATPKLYSSKPHHFLKVYTYIRQNIEGNYVYHASDKGGETYGGISRRIHPRWFGWQYIDEAKPLNRNDSVPKAEVWTLDFYLNIWVEEGFENIDDYNLALNLFDFRIHSSPRTVELFTNRVLTKMGCEETKFGRDWIDDRFNRVDAVEFILRLKIQRLILFNYIVTRHPSQKVFLKGWYRRLDNI